MPFVHRDCSMEVSIFAQNILTFKTDGSKGFSFFLSHLPCFDSYVWTLLMCLWLIDHLFTGHRTLRDRMAAVQQGDLYTLRWRRASLWEPRLNSWDGHLDGHEWAWMATRAEGKGKIYLALALWSPEMALVLVSLIKRTSSRSLSFRCRKEEEIMFCFSSFFLSLLSLGGQCIASQVACL